MLFVEVVAVVAFAVAVVAVIVVVVVARVVVIGAAGGDATVDTVSIAVVVTVASTTINNGAMVKPSMLPARHRDSISVSSQITYQNEGANGLIRPCALERGRSKGKLSILKFCHRSMNIFQSTRSTEKIFPFFVTAQRISFGPRESRRKKITTS